MQVNVMIAGASIAFASHKISEENLHKIIQHDLPAAQPTVLIGYPRMFELIHGQFIMYM